MKIGDRVLVRGVVDEIRKDTVIIKNRGGYFGTDPREIEETEQETGRWISLDDFRGKYNENGFMCSECGEHSDFEENFCPNCGARMEESTDGCEPKTDDRSRILRAVGRYIQTQAEENGLKALGVNGTVYAVEDVLQELDALIKEEEGTI